MMKPQSALIFVSVSLFIASCAANSGYEGPSPKAKAELDKALEGRIAGTPKTCISNDRATNMQIVDDNTILFHDGRTTWLQRPRGGCPGIAIGSNTLVTRSFGANQMCDGDINQLVDLRSGMQGGACVFGPFVPYTKP